MNAPDDTGRPARLPRIRVFHAYQLTVVIEGLAPPARRRARRRIALAAIGAMIALKRGLDITCHPFEAAGWSLVLSAHWSPPRAILTIEVDLRSKGVPAVTVVGTPPRGRASRRE